MLALLLFIAFGLLFGYFATMNTDLVAVRFGNATLDPIPLYILVLVSFGIGVVFASLFSMIKSFATGISLRRAEKETAQLTKQVHKLELENTELKVKTGEEGMDENSL